MCSLHYKAQESRVNSCLGLTSSSVLEYSQLLPCRHPILRTGAKSSAKTTKKCMKVTSAITESLPIMEADTSCGPKLKFLLLKQTSWMYGVQYMFATFVRKNDNKKNSYLKYMLFTASKVSFPNFKVYFHTVLYLHYFHCILVGFVNLMFFSSCCFFFGSYNIIVTFYNLKSGQFHCTLHLLTRTPKMTVPWVSSMTRVDCTPILTILP